MAPNRVPPTIVGPGAIGASLAAHLHTAGHELLICGRSPRDELDVRPDGADPIVVPGPVHTDPADVAGPADVVFLAVKATQLDDAARWLDRLCDELTVVCIVQNGVEQTELVAPLCRSTRLVPALAWFSAEPGADGSVRLRGTPALTLPRENHGVAALLESAGCDVTVTDDFVTAAWRKLLVNAVAGLMVLTGRRSGMFGREDVADVARRYLAECATVGRAAGADLPDDVVDEIVGGFAHYPADTTTSMLTDRERGRPLEWDIRNGVVLRKAREQGLPAPISEILVPLLAAAGDGPG